jgi:RNA polymerase sigma factor (sigma-70 family)
MTVTAKHLDLAARVARRWHAGHPGHPPCVDAEDFAQEAKIAVVTGASRYDPARSSFRTFAANLARGAVQHAARRASYLSSTDYQTNPHLPEAEQVREPQSLDAPVPGWDDDTMRRADLLPDHRPTPEAVVLGAAVRSEVWDAVAALPEYLRLVILGRFVDGLSQRTLAERLGISQMEVSRRERRALQTLRRALGPNLGEPQP